MSYLRRVLGLGALEQRVRELDEALDRLTERVDKLEDGGDGREYTCRDWKAWHDRMPGSTPTLHVHGRCTFPTRGWKVELRRAEPQGINPRILLLELVVTRPTGPEPRVVTEEDVKYEEESEAGFDSVTIQPDGPTIPVDTTS